MEQRDYFQRQIYLLVQGIVNILNLARKKDKVAILYEMETLKASITDESILALWKLAPQDFWSYLQKHQWNESTLSVLRHYFEVEAEAWEGMAEIEASLNAIQKSQQIHLYLCAKGHIGFQEKNQDAYYRNFISTLGGNTNDYKLM